MCQSVFEYAIDGFVDTFESLTMVDMTPIEGELTLTPNWIEMLEYLHDNDGVERFEFVTNFLDYDMKTIFKLLKYKKKFGLFISVYGHECFPITFYFRELPCDDIPRNAFISKFLRALQLVSKNDVVFDSSMAGRNYNWGGQVKDIPNLIPLGDNSGICLHAVLQNAVLPNGDITLCGMIEIDRKMLIGNIFETPLEKIYGEVSDYALYMMHYDSKSIEPEDIKDHEDKLDKIR